MGTRLFVCDPVCVQPFGHNVPALHYFATALAPRYGAVFALSCKLLPEATAAANGFKPFYDFYYHQYLPLSGFHPRRTLSAIGFVDAEEAQATVDAERMLTEFEVTADDTILFPSVDFYGIAGLLNVLRRRPAAACPRLFVRFIGVMENATSSYRAPLSELVGRIKRGLTDGLSLSFSAETPRLADDMAERLGAPVLVTPYPEVGEALTLPDDGPFVVYCPGSARHDKGFFHLLDIFRAVREADLELDIRFVTQVVPHRDALRCESYIAQLGAVPGVTLLEPAISHVEMIENYARASAVLLPYDVETYRYRGSAVMMEACFFGRPCVTLEGTAFAEQIRYYGLGHVSATVRDAAAAILKLARQPVELRRSRAAQGRLRFRVDMETAYDRWLKS